MKLIASGVMNCAAKVRSPSFSRSSSSTTTSIFPARKSSIASGIVANGINYQNTRRSQTKALIQAGCNGGQTLRIARQIYYVRYQFRRHERESVGGRGMIRVHPRPILPKLFEPRQLMGANHVGDPLPHRRAHRFTRQTLRDSFVQPCRPPPEHCQTRMYSLVREDAAHIRIHGLAAEDRNADAAVELASTPFRRVGGGPIRVLRLHDRHDFFLRETTELLRDPEILLVQRAYHLPSRFRLHGHAVVTKHHPHSHELVATLIRLRLPFHTMNQPFEVWIRL